MKKFAKKDRARRAVMHLIAESLPKDIIGDMLSAFQQCDKDGNGMLTLAEIRDSLLDHVKKNGPSESAEEVALKLAKAMDINEDGVVDYSEFMAAAMTSQQWMTTERMRAAFQKLDADGGGSIGPAELREALGDDSLADIIFGTIDVDHNGEISFEEFCSYVMDEPEGGNARTAGIMMMI